MVVALLQAEANVIDEELLAQALVEEVSQPTGSSADRLVLIMRCIMRSLVAACWLPHLSNTAATPCRTNRSVVHACVPAGYIQEADGKDKMKVLGLPDMIMQAPSLKLSFRHLRKIDNLEGFR